MFACIQAMTVAASMSLGVPPFEIEWFTIDGGGGVSEASGFQVQGTIGQWDAGPVAGPMEGSNFAVRGGFWSGARVPVCAADFNEDGDVNADDLGDYITCFFNPPCPLADFNLDGDVNADDLGDFINAYFACV